MRISVICVGRVKEQYLRDAIAEYSKRLGRYCKLDIIEVADEKTPEHASEGVERQIRAKEGGRIAKHIRPDAYVIALAIDGTMLSSEGLAAHINQLGLHGESHHTAHHRRLDRPGRRDPAPRRLQAQLLEDDVPASADARDPTGAAVPRLQNQRRRAIPQVGRWRAAHSTDLSELTGSMRSSTGLVSSCTSSANAIVAAAAIT